MPAAPLTAPPSLVLLPGGLDVDPTPDPPVDHDDGETREEGYRAQQGYVGKLAQSDLDEAALFGEIAGTLVLAGFRLAAAWTAANAWLEDNPGAGLPEWISRAPSSAIPGAPRLAMPAPRFLGLLVTPPERLRPEPAAKAVEHLVPDEQPVDLDEDEQDVPAAWEPPPSESVRETETPRCAAPPARAAAPSRADSGGGVPALVRAPVEPTAPQRGPGLRQPKGARAASIAALLRERPRSFNGILEALGDGKRGATSVCLAAMRARGVVTNDGHGLPWRLTGGAPIVHRDLKPENVVPSPKESPVMPEETNADRVVQYVTQNPGVTAKDVAEALNLSATQASGCLKSGRGRGALVREGGHHGASWSAATGAAKKRVTPKARAPKTMADVVAKAARKTAKAPRTSKAAKTNGHASSPVADPVQGALAALAQALTAKHEQVTADFQAKLAALKVLAT